VGKKTTKSLLFYLTLPCLISLFVMTGFYSANDNSQQRGAYCPQGLIIMWSGRISSIPPGWALCDGSNTTPDLTGQFILSVDTNEDPGGVGGSSTTTLSLDNLALHNHAMNHEHDSNEGTHYHTVIDPGHDHVTHNSPNNHTLTNDSHNHAVIDPGHGHGIGDRKIEQWGGSSYPYVIPQVIGSYQHWTTESSTVDLGVQSTTTGITETSFSQSGVSIDATLTGISTSNSVTSISIGPSSHDLTGKKGYGVPFTNQPDYYKLAFIMKL